jgi:hypothetical protein
VNTFDPGLMAGITGILMAAACLVLWRKYQRTTESRHQELAASLEQHRAECVEKMDQLGRNLAVLETSAQNIENLGEAALTRSRRSHAMQLLRSGMSPETAAASLGIARREMRLIARVSSILSSH